MDTPEKKPPEPRMRKKPAGPPKSQREVGSNLRSGRAGPLERVVLASLALLVLTSSFRTAWIYGLLTAATFFLSALAFPVVLARLRDSLREAVLAAWVLALVLLGHFFFDCNPLWGAGLFLMLSGSEGRPRLSLLGEALGLCVLMAYLGFCREVLGTRLHLPVFDGPVGAFFLLAFAAAVWEARPGR